VRPSVNFRLAISRPDRVVSSTPNRMTIIHVTPELPPTTGGISDFTVRLSRCFCELSKEEELEVILVRAGWKAGSEVKVPFPCVDLQGQESSSALAKTIVRLAGEAAGPSVILLEYSGYGYAKRGAPRWLAQAIRQVTNKHFPVVTFFHELYASTWKPWSSTFWLSFLQKRIARSIARHSRALITSHPSAAKQLSTVVQDQPPLSVQSIFSNVGEPSTRAQIRDRDRLAVVFGGKQEKSVLYAQTDRLDTLFQRCDIDQLVDVGPVPNRIPNLSVPVDVQGIQPAEAVSQVLRRSRVGLAHRRLDLMTKSGIVAAYLAHGVPPVILPRLCSFPSPLLVEGEHFLTLTQASASVVNWEHVSRSGFTWYQEHAHSREAARTLLKYVRMQAHI